MIDFLLENEVCLDTENDNRLKPINLSKNDKVKEYLKTK